MSTATAMATTTAIDPVLQKSDFDIKIEEPPAAYTVPSTFYVDESLPTTPRDEYELPTLPTTRAPSLAPSAEPINALSPEERKRARRREYICFGTLCWSIWLEGWNDGSNGPLLPRMQENYHVS